MLLLIFSPLWAPKSTLIPEPPEPEMALGTKYADDWLNWEEREDITLRARDSLDPTYTDYTVTASEGGAKRRALTTKEIIRSNGVYTGRNQAWLLPRANMPTVSGNKLVPKPGWIVKDGDNNSHVILEVQSGKYGQTHKCITIIVNLEAGLTMLGDLLRYPVTASNQRDEAGRPTYVDPVTVLSSVPCRLQPADSGVESILGRKVTPQDFIAILGITNLAPNSVRAHDRFRVSDPDEPTAGSTDYTITGTQDLQRLDENAKLLLRAIT